MGRFITFLIIVAIAVAGGGYLWTQYTDQEAKANLKAATVDARRSFAELARVAVREEKYEEFRRQILSALATYEEELTERVYAARPEWRDVEYFRNEVERRFSDGQLPEARRKSMLEAFEIVSGAHQTLTKGRWKPILTQGSGDTRLEIYDMRRVRDEDGNPLLEGRFFFWGIEDNTRVNWGQLSLRYWHTVEKKVRKGGRRVLASVEEVLGRVEGDATPRVIIQQPHEYIAEFPSYVSVGYIRIPMMPRQAEKFDLSFGFVAKKGGGSHDAQLRWKKLPVPARWQLQEGEAWNADVVEASEEEIAGTDAP
ncbi:MAG: hypothetical protein AAFN74_14575 [Myxococcota bacterium]